MSQVVSQGLNGPFLITQGYGPAAPITIVLSPYAPVVAVLSVTHVTTNIAANWVLSGGGSLVVAPDGLSADYTAPGSPATPTLTATDQTDPGNTASTPIFVTSFGPLTQGEIVPPNSVGRSVVEQ